MVDKTTWRKNEPVNSRRHAPTVYRPLRYLQRMVKEPGKNRRGYRVSVYADGGFSFNLDNSSPRTTADIRVPPIIN